MSFRKTVLALCTVIATILLQTPAMAQTDVFSWSGSLANGQQLEVLTVNGNIGVTPSTGNAVSIRAEKTARRGSTADVEIKVEQEAGGIVVCTLYRRADGTFPASCRDRNSSNQKGGWNRSDVRVELSIQMPAMVNLSAKTVNGSAAIRGLQAGVEANTVNGDLTLETAGSASAKTVNGKVEARIGRIEKDCTFSTVNGRILVAVASAVNADVSMATVNGKIETDLPVTIQGKMSARKLEGRIGAGGPKLNLNTVNGGIRIEKDTI